ncbi:MAG TPA: Crp/Fnr family transcriptional regulator [Candidatus Gemmiger excrementigallinarum]|uniref:Crp/Fnr family transcriptional regulator n=1 Tax=Candidatus Gemmiger excrementigallinarum TaxID=2838609 RepID=A0A9D2EPF2_9FIRM|nr:Crp/Fnr family transcriptional regulator [Candidatus Gemmiger excrementigallinarum]
MDSDAYLLQRLEQWGYVPEERSRHTYLAYCGLDQPFTYVLAHGVVKTSIILKNGKEFNIAYLKGPSLISLLRDEVSTFTSAPFNIRVESETAVFYKVPRVALWQNINQDPVLQQYVKEYYRQRWNESIRNQQLMAMNSKRGVICGFLLNLAQQFGRPVEGGTLIDFVVPYEDIAGFCGISTRNSVNRLITHLREDGLLKLQDRHILIPSLERLREQIAE